MNNLAKIFIALMLFITLVPIVSLAYGGGFSSGSSFHSSGSFSGIHVSPTPSFSGGFHTSIPSTGSFSGGSDISTVTEPAFHYTPSYNYVHSSLSLNPFNGNFFLWYLLFIAPKHNKDNTQICTDKITINCMKLK